MDKLESYGFGDEICNTTKKYWNEGGAEVKEYRDIDQHYFAIIRHTFLQVKPEERVLVYLPDDPHEKSSKHVSFAKKRDAIPFFKNAFFSFHQFAEDVASHLGFQPALLDQSIGMEQLGPLAIGTRKTLALVLEDTGRCSGLEFGQTEDRRIYIRQLK